MQIYYIDSTPLSVCKNQRIHKDKTFKNLAERDKCSMGQFYGFKLHLTIVLLYKLFFVENYIYAGGLTNKLEEITKFKIIKINNKL